ncbi:hypothetical protein PAECIP111892_02951 [Paenibacillus auburnensis]|uniref:Uncharacterized protein n=1 Tax=Paenibacillus auburnensis TaxID=2905649 RepID=A0ABN8GLP0_9BACL|nr:hypothetical protein [Paenibacillus auburnensis]CAH1207641.1 hypothetical protein PAECIP111892_02951 [Paenibacillus auburnensis]
MMKIKFRNILRVSFLIILCLILVVLFHRYEGYERRALLFELTREWIIFYLVLVELSLFLMRKLKSFYGLFKRIVFVLISGIPLIILILFMINDIYKLSMDAFVLGYHSKEVMIIDRYSQYKTSDKVKITVDGEIYTYSLYPGYIDAKKGKHYQANLFKMSKIMISVKERNND